MEDIVEELFIVLNKRKIAVDWDTAGAYSSHLFTELIPPTRDHFSSMLQDIRHGKKTEIDALNGKVVRWQKKWHRPAGKQGAYGAGKREKAVILGSQSSY